MFDKDGSGLVNKEHIREVVLSLGEEVTDKELDDMILSVDKDEDGFMDFEGSANLYLNFIHLCFCKIHNAIFIDFFLSLFNSEFLALVRH